MGMERSGPIKGPQVAGELAKIARVVGDVHLRQSLRQDAKGTLAKAGVDMGLIPQSLVEVLSGMSHEELDAVSRLNDALVDAGFEVQPPGEYPDGGRVGFF